MATEMSVIAAAIVTGGASFAGATLAQYLSHHFSLVRERAVTIEKKKNYIRHITFDIVLAVASLESILNAAGITNASEAYEWTGTSNLSVDQTNLIDKLDLDLTVSPQFILNSRKFFSNYKHYAERWRNTEIGFELQMFHLAATIELYFQGLSYIIGGLRVVEKSYFQDKKRIKLKKPNYIEVCKAYSEITFNPPNEEIFSAADALRKKWLYSIGQVEEF